MIEPDVSYLKGLQAAENKVQEIGYESARNFICGDLFPFGEHKGRCFYVGVHDYIHFHHRRLTND